MVLRNEPVPREYAESILAMAERSTQLAPLGISLSSVGELEQRIRRIITDRVPGLEIRLGRTAIIGVFLFGVALTTGVVLAQVPAVPTVRNADSVAPEVANSSSVLQPAEFGNENSPATLISGTVLLANGEPAADAKLRIVGHRRSGIDARLNIDLAGRFEFFVTTSYSWRFQRTQRD